MTEKTFAATLMRYGKTISDVSFLHVEGLSFKPGTTAPTLSFHFTDWDLRIVSPHKWDNNSKAEIARELFDNARGYEYSKQPFPVIINYVGDYIRFLLPSTYDGKGLYQNSTDYTVYEWTFSDSDVHVQIIGYARGLLRVYEKSFVNPTLSDRKSIEKRLTQTYLARIEKLELLTVKHYRSLANLKRTWYKDI